MSKAATSLWVAVKRGRRTSNVARALLHVLRHRSVVGAPALRQTLADLLQLALFLFR
jgi:hypothetical protein